VARTARLKGEADQTREEVKRLKAIEKVMLAAPAGRHGDQRMQEGQPPTNA
jgi:hypothetical protein